jgi:hypothetical protein
MENEQYYKLVDEVCEEWLSNCADKVADIGRLNEVMMETSRRRRNL